MARAARVAGFLIVWASSATTVDQAIGAEVVDVAREQSVRRDHEVGAGELVAGRLADGPGPVGPVMDHDAQRRREAGSLGLPVVDDRERADDEVRARPAEQVGQGGGGLAEPHVVGQAPTQPEGFEESQPREPPPLVRTQRADEPGWFA